MALSKIPADLITGGLSVDPAAPADAITVDSSGNLTVDGSVVVNGATTNSNANWGYYINPKSGGAVGDFTFTDPTGNFGRLNIDGSGRVTMPYQPAFMVIGDGRAAYGPGTNFVYGTTRFNVGNHYSTSTGRFTAPIAGRYAFYANSMGDSAAGRLMLRIVINGTDYHQGSSSSNSSQFQDSKLFVLALLNAGDYVYVRNNGSKSTYIFNDLEQWFCGYLIG
jgi:hypothetical protein